MPSSVRSPGAPPPPWRAPARNRRGGRGPPRKPRSHPSGRGSAPPAQLGAPAPEVARHHGADGERQTAAKAIRPMAMMFWRSPVRDPGRRLRDVVDPAEQWTPRASRCPEEARPDLRARLARHPRATKPCRAKVSARTTPQAAVSKIADEHERSVLSASTTSPIGASPGSGGAALARRGRARHRPEHPMSSPSQCAGFPSPPHAAASGRG